MITAMRIFGMCSRTENPALSGTAMMTIYMIVVPAQQAIKNKTRQGKLPGVSYAQRCANVSSVRGVRRRRHRSCRDHAAACLLPGSRE